MKKYILGIVILAISHFSQAQAYNYEMLGTDSVKFYVKLDSAIKVTPDFGFTMVDTAKLIMQIFKPDLYEEITELIENFDPYKEISTHLEGGWEVAANSDNDEYYLIKPLKGDKYWIKKLTKSISNEYYKSALMLFKIDCIEGMWGIVQATEYDAKGVVTSSIPTVEDFLVDMSYAEPDSVGEAFVKSACK